MTNIIPPIMQTFNPHLLSTPYFKFDAEYLHKIAQYLQKRIQNPKYRKFPTTLKDLEKQHKIFMDLYERAKIQEREIEEERFVKAKMPFYRTRLPKQNDGAIFRRLENKARFSDSNRKLCKI